MKLYCSCCDKVQPVFVGDCMDANTNEPYQDIVCAECCLVIASGTGIEQRTPSVSQGLDVDPLEIRDKDGSTVFRITSNGDLYQRGKIIEGDDALRTATTEFVRRFTQLCNPLYAAPVRTKDLTDDDLNKLLDYWSEDERSAYGGAWSADGEYVDMKSFARAVIAADREKNK